MSGKNTFAAAYGRRGGKRRPRGVAVREGHRALTVPGLLLLSVLAVAFLLLSAFAPFASQAAAAPTALIPYPDSFAKAGVKSPATPATPKGSPFLTAPDHPVRAAMERAGSQTMRATAGTGVISGRVTAAGGAPLAGVEIWVLATDQFLTVLGNTVTDASGYYTVGDLDNVAAKICTYCEAPLNYVDEWYDDHQFPGDWMGEGATTLDLAAIPTRTNIDFELLAGRSISGTVTDSGGTGIFDVTVTAYSLEAYPYSEAYTDANGDYVIMGLPAEPYILLTQNGAGYIDEFYDDDPFVSDPDALEADPVDVTSANATGIDFSLAQGMTISGSITDEAGGGPVEWCTINIHNLQGVFVQQVQADENGLYAVPGLPPAQYLLRTVNPWGYVDEWYEDDPVLLDPFGGSATPVDVSTTNDIDTNFVLQMGRAVTGVVTGTADGGATSAPLANAYVVVQPAGAEFAVAGLTNENGEYVAEGLLPGVYAVNTYNELGFIDEWYDNVPVPGNLTGIGITPVDLSTADNEDVNFLLEKGYTISGEVTDNATGLALADPGMAVEVYDAAGDLFSYSWVGGDAGTAYTSWALPAGTYFAKVTDEQATGQYVEEWFDDLPVTLYGLADATPIPIANANVTGIDFGLSDTVVPVPPVITLIAPDSGTADGGTPVVITGTGLTAADSVTFDGTAATITGNTATQIAVTTPAHAVGLVEVKVTTPSGFATTSFTYTEPITLNRYEQTDMRIAKTGSWANFATANASAGSYGRCSTAGASATIHFHGTKLDWIGMKGVTTGKADVYVDDVFKTTVDLTATAATYQVPLWSTGDLTLGDHKVRIVRNTGSAAGKFVTLDAVDIMGTISAPPPTLTRYEQTDARIAKTGSWANFATANASAGSYGRCATAGASTTIYFHGTKLDWIGMKGTTTGKADVYVDDVFKTTIDLTASVATYQVPLWSTGDLTLGDHKVRIVRNTDSAAGKYVTLDAVDIMGTLTSGPAPAYTRYQQTDSKIIKTGAWADFAKAAASAGSYGRSATAGATATISFHGTRLDWIGMKGTTTGKADVYVDDVFKTTVDLTATAATYQVPLWSTGDLTLGDHKVRIVRNTDSAAGKYVTLDAVDIWGTLK